VPLSAPLPSLVALLQLLVAQQRARSPVRPVSRALPLSMPLALLQLLLLLRYHQLLVSQRSRYSSQARAIA